MKKAKKAIPQTATASKNKKLILNPNKLAMKPAARRLTDSPMLVDIPPKPCIRLKRPVFNATSELISKSNDCPFVLRGINE